MSDSSSSDEGTDDSESVLSRSYYESDFLSRSDDEYDSDSLSSTSDCTDDSSSDDEDYDDFEDNSDDDEDEAASWASWDYECSTPTSGSGPSAKSRRL
jgi:hypothetical protein